MKVIKNIVLSSIILLSVISTSCASNSANNKETVLNEKDTLFIESMKEYKFSMIQSQSTTEFGKPFGKPFIVQVKDSKGKSVPNFDVSITYPSSKKDLEVIHKTVNIKTDEEGKITFLPNNYNFTVTDKIYFYATPKRKNQEKSLKEIGLALDYKIKSSLFTRGAILVIWEYNEKNKAANNFYSLISVLQSEGISKVGNAPISDLNTLKLSKQEIYNANYEIIHNDFGYLIGGTVKFSKPYEKTEKGYKVYLSADLYVLDMNDGKEIFNTIIEIETEDPKYNNAVSSAKKLVSKKFISEFSSKF